MEINIITAQRAVTAAGTPESIKEAPEQTNNKAIAIKIRAKTGNAGDIYITRGEQRATAATTGDIIAPGEIWVLDVSQYKGKNGQQAFIDLSKIWVDAANAGDQITYTAVLLQ